MNNAMIPFWRKTSTPNQQAEKVEKEIEQLRSRLPIPTLWLLGKTGSGKSSIVRYLTGAEAATIGQGFRPETKSSRRYDFPDSKEPLLSFIDTRGLGEADYDPTADIERFDKEAQLLIVTVRVTDHALDGVIEPLRRIRKASPNRPVLLVLTCLHLAPGAEDISASDAFATQVDIHLTEVKPGKDAEHKSAEHKSAEHQAAEHQAADPQSAEPASVAGRVSDQADGRLDSQPSSIPPTLQLLLDEKARQFSGLYDALIPIDLTQPEDGYPDPNFGGQRLKQAILEKLPHAYRQALLVLNQKDGQESGRQQRARWQVLTSSAMAGTAGAVPVPWVDIPVVLAVQTHLAYRIARVYEQSIDASDWAMISGATGSRIALRLAVMEAVKFIPFWGMAVGAASSFAFTYAVGMSWSWYFAHKRAGDVPSAERMREIFKEQLKRGHELWRAE